MCTLLAHKLSADAIPRVNITLLIVVAISVWYTMQKSTVSMVISNVTSN